MLLEERIFKNSQGLELALHLFVPPLADDALKRID
jgi:hypothetical protein